MKNLAKRDKSPSEPFSLKCTLDDYEVEELNAHQAESLLANIRAPAGSRGALGRNESGAD
jgi:hypothetical protein